MAQREAESDGAAEGFTENCRLRLTLIRYDRGYVVAKIVVCELASFARAKSHNPEASRQRLCLFEQQPAGAVEARVVDKQRTRAFNRISRREFWRIG